MTVLVIGATGAAGEEVVSALLARGAAVVALVRGPACAALLPGGVIPRIGDPGDPTTVAEAAAGVRAVVVVEGEASVLGVTTAVCAAASTMLVVVENGDHGPWIDAVVAAPLSPGA